MKQNDFELFYDKTKKNTIEMQDCLYGIYIRVRNNPQNRELMQSFSELCYVCQNMLNTLGSMASIHPETSIQKSELNNVRERLEAIKHWQMAVRQVSFQATQKPMDKTEPIEEEHKNMGILE